MRQALALLLSVLVPVSPVAAQIAERAGAPVPSSAAGPFATVQEAAQAADEVLSRLPDADDQLLPHLTRLADQLPDDPRSRAAVRLVVAAASGQASLSELGLDGEALERLSKLGERVRKAASAATDGERLLAGLQERVRSWTSAPEPEPIPEGKLRRDGLDSRASAELEPSVRVAEGAASGLSARRRKQSVAEDAVLGPEGAVRDAGDVPARQAELVEVARRAEAAARRAAVERPWASLWTDILRAFRRASAAGLTGAAAVGAAVLGDSLGVAFPGAAAAFASPALAASAGLWAAGAALGAAAVIVHRLSLPYGGVTKGRPTSETPLQRVRRVLGDLRQRPALLAGAAAASVAALGPAALVLAGAAGAAAHAILILGVAGSVSLAAYGGLAFRWSDRLLYGLTWNSARLGDAFRLRWERWTAPGSESVAALEARLVSALERADPSDPVFDHPDVAYAATAAAESGRITQGQMITVILRWEARGDLRSRTRRRTHVAALDAEGRLTSEARGSFGGSRELYEGFRVSLDDRELARFEGLLRTLPASERTYSILEVGRLGALQHIHNETQRVLFKAAFGRPSFVAPGREFVAVPSFGILQALLGARFGEDAVELLPSFEPTSMNELLKGIGKGGRVFGLHLPGRRQDVFADGIYMGRFFFSMHDWFHAWVGSQAPAEFRRLVPRLVVVARKRRKALESHALKEPSRSVRAHLDYVVEENRRKVRFFGDLIFSTNGQPGLSIGERLTREFQYHDSLASEDGGILGAIARDMALHPEAWSSGDLSAEVSKLGPDAEQAYREALQERLGTVASGRGPSDPSPAGPSAVAVRVQRP